MTFGATAVTWRHVAILVLAVLAVFGNSLLNGFVWDDNIFLLGNEAFKHVSLQRILFSVINSVEYFPVRDLTLALDFYLWGETARAFHLTNLFYYALNAIAVYFLALEASLCLKLPGEPVDSTLTPLFCALLFVVHPIHSESVAFISSRGTLLAGLFVFLSSFFFLRYLREEGKRAGTYYCAALVAFILSLLSKAYGIALPLALLSFTFFSPGKRRGEKAVALVPFFAVAVLAYLFFKEIAVRMKAVPHDASLTGGDLGAKLAKALQIPFFYLYKLIIPSNFSADYDIAFAGSLAAPPAVAAALGVTLLLCVAIATRKRHPQLLFSLCWFILIMIPFLNFFATDPVVTDRYAYLPSFGFCYFLATQPQRSLPFGARRTLLCLGAILIAVFSVLAIARNGVWRSDKTLWEDTLRVSPRSLRGYINLGNVYLAEKNYTRAFALFRKAQEINPCDSTYEIYLGDALFEKGEYAAAIASYHSALVRNPNSLLALAQLGQAYEKTGETEQAIETYTRLIRSGEPEPNNTRHNDARVRRALLYANSERDAEALGDYLELEREGVRTWQLYFNIARSCAKLEKRREAIAYYVMSLEKNGRNTDALNNLGILYRDEKKYDQAIAALERAMTLDASFPFAPFNLAVTFLEKGDMKNARKYFDDTLKRFPQLRANAAPYLSRLQP